MFGQLNRSDPRSQGGLGIGLALAKRLAQLHGGARLGKRRLGRGSRFTVSLPLLSGVNPSASALPAAGPPAAPLRKVLVVDDNHDAADSTGMLLCMLRADARVVHDGASALELLEAWKPQLLLLDLACPAWTA